MFCLHPIGPKSSIPSPLFFLLIVTDLVELIQFYSSELIFPLDIDTACYFS